MRTIWARCSGIGVFRHGIRSFRWLSARNKRKRRPGPRAFAPPLIFPFSRLAPGQTFELFAILSFQQNRFMELQVAPGRSELPAVRNIVSYRFQGFGELHKLGA